MNLWTYDRYGMRMHWLCRLFGHRWEPAWNPVGHIEDAEWRHCRRGCSTGEMRYVSDSGHPQMPSEKVPR